MMKGAQTHANESNRGICLGGSIFSGHPPPRHPLRHHLNLHIHHSLTHYGLLALIAQIPNPSIDKPEKERQKERARPEVDHVRRDIAVPDSPFELVIVFLIVSEEKNSSQNKGRVKLKRVIAF